MTKPGINEFYDINKYPADYGISVLGISIPQINTKQKPENCFSFDERQISKIRMSGVGANIVYSDGLYLNTEKPAGDLNHKYQKLIEEHKSGYKKLIKKNINIIPNSFSFSTWSQHVLECTNFSEYFRKIKEFYKSDEKIKDYVRKDILGAGKAVDEYSINYILEEILVDFLTVKGEVNLPNEYVGGKYVWILNNYHGRPHRSLVYLHQQNPFNLQNTQNPYENAWYDAEKFLLYEFDRLDIETFGFR